jgi:hypothetical protein
LRKPLPLLFALALALLATPAQAGDLDLSLHLGADKYDAVGLESGLGGVSRSAMLKDTSTTVGVTAIYRAEALEFGVIGEIGRPGQDGSTSLLGLLGGVGASLGGVRLEALGELGGHRYGDAIRDSRVTAWSARETWLVSVGLRPGVSIRLGANQGLLLGLWGYARWDVTSEDVVVRVGSGTADSTYKLGGSQFGLALRLGFSL